MNDPQGLDDREGKVPVLRWPTEEGASSLQSQAALGESLKSICWSAVTQASGGDDVKQNLGPVRVVGEGIG